MNQLRMMKKSRVLQSIGAVLLVAGFYLVTTAGAPRQPAARLLEVKFEAMVAELTEDNPLWAGGGQRVFPDKDWPTDGSDYTKVKVVAKVDGAEKGTVVYFRVFDVDDPSTDVFPADLNGPAGRDNRGTYNGGTPIDKYTNPRWDRTDEGGIAEAVFSVTKKPGDNFVVAASLNEGYLNGIHDSPIAGNPARLVDADGNPLPTANAVQTGLLTVWRRLHIEVDSMGLVDRNHVKGTVKAVNWVPGQTHVILDQPLEPGRFKPGRIEIAGTSFPVIGNNSVRVIVAGDARGLAGEEYKLYDDDDFNINDGAAGLHGDEGEDVDMPDKELVSDPDKYLLQNSTDPKKNLLAYAFVQPSYDIDARDDNVAFLLNEVSDSASDLKATYKFDHRDWEANKDFWTVYLFGAYQHTLREDNDPVRESATFGIVDDFVGEGASIFLEPIREVGNTGVYSRSAVAAHEICHLFDARHGEGGIMDGKSLDLDPKTINTIRFANHP